MQQYDLIVIGSGPAGEKGAAQAAYFGKRVALIEQMRALQAERASIPAPFRAKSSANRRFIFRELTPAWFIRRRLFAERGPDRQEFHASQGCDRRNERQKVAAESGRSGKIELVRGLASFDGCDTVCVRKFAAG